MTSRNLDAYLTANPECSVEISRLVLHPGAAAPYIATLFNSAGAADVAVCYAEGATLLAALEALDSRIA